MRRAAALSLVLWAGCYAPRPPAGVPCSAGGACPRGEQCIADVCTSDSGAAGSDTPLPDAALPDAAAAPDAQANEPTCATTDTCIAAPTLGAISGDTGHQTLHATGSTAAWFRVRVTENDDDIAGQPVRIAASLTPPAAGSFTVEIYVDTATDTVECAAAVGTHSMSGTVELVRAEWGEMVVANGVDDGRDVSIAIVPTGACAPDATWELTLEGNWN